MRHWTNRSLFALLMACLAFAGAAYSQTWPAQRVTIIVPLPAGGPVDVAARVLAPILEQAWKQSVLVENRPGAGTMLGSAAVATAKPDGYTLLLNASGTHTSKIFTKSMPYDTADLRPVVEVAGSGYLIATHPSVPAKTLKEMVALARERGRSLNYGTIPFTTYDFDNQLFMKRAGITITPVPYNGGAPATLAAVRGEIQFYLAIPGPLIPMVNDGKLVALAVTGSQRNVMLPNVPTAREQGYDFVSGFTVGIWAPTKTPDPVIARLGADVSAAVLSPAYTARLKEFNLEVSPQPLNWPDRIQAEVKAYADLARELNIQPQ